MSGQSGLFDAEEKEIAATIPADVLPVVEPMPEKERLSQEKLLLGIYVTENPIGKILKNFQGVSLPKITELINREANAAVKFVAVINKIKVIRTKKDNSQMAFITFEDTSGQVEGVIFPKSYEKYLAILTENRPVYVEGKISVRDESKSILVDSVSEDLPENVAKYDYVIEVPVGTSQTQLMNLNNLLKKNPNGHRGLIILPNGKNITVPYGVNYTPSLQSEIDQILSLK